MDVMEADAAWDPRGRVMVERRGELSLRKDEPVAVARGGDQVPPGPCPTRHHGVVAAHERRIRRAGAHEDVPDVTATSVKLGQRIAARRRDGDTRCSLQTPGHDALGVRVAGHDVAGLDWCARDERRVGGRGDPGPASRWRRFPARASEPWLEGLRVQRGRGRLCPRTPQSARQHVASAPPGPTGHARGDLVPSDEVACQTRGAIRRKTEVHPFRLPPAAAQRRGPGRQKEVAGQCTPLCSEWTWAMLRGP